MADIDLRKLERAFRAGDTSALVPYIAECKRTGTMPDHALAIAYILSILRSVDQDIYVSFTQLAFWVIEALSLNVILLTDSDFQDFIGSSEIGLEWFILPTVNELTTLKERRRPHAWMRREWSPILLLGYDGDSSSHAINEISTKWSVSPKYIKIDFVNTYQDIMERALNPRGQYGRH